MQYKSKVYLNLGTYNDQRKVFTENDIAMQI